MLTDRQLLICQVVLHFQKKYGRAFLYANNGDKDSICNLLVKKYGNSEWIQDLKLLVSIHVLREELGGVYYFNNRLCACTSFSFVRKVVKKKQLPTLGLTVTESLQLALGEKVTLDAKASERMVQKFGKRKKLLGARHAAKVANQVVGKINKIELIDLKIQELEKQKKHIREKVL